MSKRALLNEEVTRRMMKLANIGATNAQNFITEAYEDLEEADASPVNEEEGLNEESEEEATEAELGHEDDVADEEGAELDALEGGDMEADLAADEEAAMDVEGGGKEEQFKTIVDMLADLLDVDADVELEGGEELEDEVEVDTPEGDLEVEDEEEVDLMEALTSRVMGRIEEARRQKARKGQIAESVADRIMKRLES